MERKFKFVGDPKEYAWDINPIYKNYYSLDEISYMRGKNESADYIYDLFKNDDDFQELIDPKDFGAIPDQKQLPRIPNQDMPASSMTKFEMAVLGNTSILLGLDPCIDDHDIVGRSIKLAKETFRQLNELK